MRVTENCAVNAGLAGPSTSTSRDIQPYTSPRRRRAGPVHRAVRRRRPATPNIWVAGGQHVWVNTKGYAIRNGKGWTQRLRPGRRAHRHRGRPSPAASPTSAGAARATTPASPAASRSATSTAPAGTSSPCPSTALSRTGSSQGVGVDPANPDHAFVAVNGFSRRFTEGPGAGVGHVFETSDRGATWTDVSANLPDVPASSVKVLPNGGAGPRHRPGRLLPGARRRRDWQRLGTGLPLTVGMDVEYSPRQHHVRGHPRPRHLVLRPVPALAVGGRGARSGTGPPGPDNGRPRPLPPGAGPAPSVCCDAVAVGSGGRAQPGTEGECAAGAVGALGPDGPAAGNGEDPVGAPFVAGAGPGAAAVGVRTIRARRWAPPGPLGRSVSSPEPGDPQRDLDRFAGRQPGSAQEQQRPEHPGCARRPRRPRP